MAPKRAILKYRYQFLVNKNIVNLSNVWLQRFEGVGQEDYDYVIDTIRDDENLVRNLKLQRFFGTFQSGTYKAFPTGSHMLPTSNGLS